MHAILQDPLYYAGKVRIRTAISCKHAMEDLARQYDELSCPICVFHGSSDKVTYIGGVKALLEGCSS